MSKALKVGLPLILILTALSLRLYRISELTTVGGDQGYDFAQIKKIAQGRPSLIGPKNVHLEGVYLGPAYYYFLLPSLALSNFDPIGPAIFTALVSTVTVIVIYLISLRFFNTSVAIVSGLFYATNPFLIEQSRTAQPPHLTPLFSAFALFAVFEITRKKTASSLWPVLAGVCAGIVVQFHYLGIALLAFILISIMFGLTPSRSKKTTISVIKNLAKVIFGFSVGISPQIIFELRHQFFITSQILKTVGDNQNVSASPTFYDHISQGFSDFSRLIMGSNLNTTLMIFLAIAFTFIYCLRNKKQKTYVLNCFVITIIVFLSASIYSGPILSHYLAVAYIPMVLLISTVLHQFIFLFKNPAIRTISLIIVAQLYANFLLKTDLNNEHGYSMPAGWNLRGIRAAAKIIASDADGHFNVVSTLDGDTRAMPTRYLVDVYGKTPQPVENYSKDLTAIYVISRDDNSKILQYTVWEVSNYKPFIISQGWHIQNGIRVVKLEKTHFNEI